MGAKKKRQKRSVVSIASAEARPFDYSWPAPPLSPPRRRRRVVGVDDVCWQSGSSCASQAKPGEDALLLFPFLWTCQPVNQCAGKYHADARFRSEMVPYFAPKGREGKRDFSAVVHNLHNFPNLCLLFLSPFSRSDRLFLTLLHDDESQINIVVIPVFISGRKSARMQKKESFLLAGRVSPPSSSFLSDDPFPIANRSKREEREG